MANRVSEESNRISDFEETNVVEADETDFDVVIIGAGLSGLTAANRLISAGLNILILEQTGGRLLSINESKSFYAHELQSRLNEMLVHLNLKKTRQKYPDTRKILHFGKTRILNENDLPPYVAGEVDKASKSFHFKVYKHPRINEALSNMSVENVVCRLVFFSQSRVICRNLIYSTCGVTNLNSISALWYFVMLSGAGGFLQRLRVGLGDANRYYIPGGAMNIAKLLIDNITEKSEIQYHEAVHKILFNDDRAHVWTEKGHYKCHYVIIAVPPIHTSKIRIDPPLPANLKKIHTSFNQGNNIFFNLLCTESSENNNLPKNVIAIGNQTLTLQSAYDATCFGEEKLHISGFLSEPNDNENMGVNLISLMNQCFNCMTLSTLDEYTETNRSEDFGAPMCVLKPMHLRNHLDLVSQMHGRIFFAASEYASSWPGTVDGAIEAGESAAFSVLQNIRPQSMKRIEWILFKLAAIILNIFNIRGENKLLYEH